MDGHGHDCNKGEVTKFPDVSWFLKCPRVQQEPHYPKHMPLVLFQGLQHFSIEHPASRSLEVKRHAESCRPLGGQRSKDVKTEACARDTNRVKCCVLNSFVFRDGPKVGSVKRRVRIAGHCPKRKSKSYCLSVIFGQLLEVEIC